MSNYTNKDVRFLIDVMESISLLQGKSFAVAVNENKKILNDYFNQLKIKTSKLPLDEETLNYKNLENKIYEKYAKKNENGSIVVNAQRQYVFDNPILVQREIEKLRVDFKDCYVKADEYNKKMSDLMSEELKLDFVKIPMSDVSEQINAYQLEDIQFMISKLETL